MIQLLLLLTGIACFMFGRLTADKDQSYQEGWEDGRGEKD